MEDTSPSDYISPDLPPEEQEKVMRRLRNRFAQRAFRERQRNYIDELEGKERLLREKQVENRRLGETVAELQERVERARFECSIARRETMDIAEEDKVWDMWAGRLHAQNAQLEAKLRLFGVQPPAAPAPQLPPPAASLAPSLPTFSQTALQSLASRKQPGQHPPQIQYTIGPGPQRYGQSPR